jgi:quinone-modifying oxidoreductase subunit QmoC
MAAMLVEPDVAFVDEVIASGGGDVKKCFQCGTCSVVCELSPDHATFPRRQMLQAQWGQKQALLADPSLWLCHNCGECTDRCPRGARPGDVLGALRSAAIRHYAFPSLLGRFVAASEALPLLLLLPAFLFGAIALTSESRAEGPLEFAAVFPQATLEIFFFSISGLALLAFGVGLARFLRAIGGGGATVSLAAGLIPALAAIATHARFRACVAGGRGRRWGHLLTFWGFVGLAAVGTIVGIGTLAGLMHTPLALTNPWKILANVCAVAAFAGVTILLADRLGAARRARSTYFDWFFLLTLFGVLATGIASEILRLGQVATVMYIVYFVHLVLVCALFLYAPYSKFAHLAYRAAAMAVATANVPRRRDVYDTRGAARVVAGSRGQMAR